MTTVSDATANVVEINGRRFCVFDFPSADRTLIYNIEAGDWCEWGYWDKTDMAYKRFLGQSYCFAPTWGKHLVGSRKESVIHELTPTAHDDNGDEIRVLRRTGHIDYGTPRRKRCKRAWIRLKRGAADVTDPKLILRFKDDGANKWSNNIEIDLGNIGETEITRQIPMRGVYRTRQYELYGTDAVPIVYGEMFEDVSVLRD